MKNPLDVKILKDLLKTKLDGSLYKRESTSLEFKADFDWESRLARVKYIKAIAAFANRSGGYLIFGVSDSPRKLEGITKDFMSIDDAVIGQFINQFIAPCPNFEREEFKIGELRFGALYVYPSESKPVICIKDYDKTLHESSIYYRYSGQSCIIKSSDLMQLLNTAKQNETDKWMQFFAKVSSIGVNNAGVFDVSSGKLSTTKGNTFILDENLLKHIKVLDKYSEQENGAEAVKIIGEIDRTGTVINRPFAIHDDDIIKGFLLEKEIFAPNEYIEAMCYQSSGFMPIYYYIKKAGISKGAVSNLINRSKSRSQAKKKLISRLTDDSKICLDLPMDNRTAVRSKRQFYYNQIINSDEVKFKTIGEVKRLLEAICNLKKNTYDSESIKKILLDIFNGYYQSDLSTLLRQTICYIDLIENS
jgi:hypothetical protein